MVPQDPILFHRTLRENIAYGKPDASEKEIIAAAKMARCHEFIIGFKEGYETLVGERGIKLSG
jgi:ATP-binding cassette subfamily B protein